MEGANSPSGIDSRALQIHPAADAAAAFMALNTRGRMRTRALLRRNLGPGALDFGVQSGAVATCLQAGGRPGLNDT